MTFAERLKKHERPLLWLRRAMRFGIPLLIGYLIVTRIDFGVLKSAFLGTRSYLFVVGLMHAPVLILLAAFRWKVMLGQYLKKDVSPKFAVSQYWVGQALGFFTPASLGLDAYRIVVGGRKFGSYTKNTLIIFIEKLLALVTCMSIIVVLYPLVPKIMDKEVKDVVLVAYGLLLMVLAGVMIMAAAARNKVLTLMLRKLAGMVTRTLGTLGKKMGIGPENGEINLSLKTIVEPLKSPRFLTVILLSFGIQLVSSVKSQLYFVSLGYDLPFLINLFVTPMIYFIFLLPISLGSIGIREGVYIVLFGLFGVPAEIALLVSFYNLLGILLNNAVGGIFILFARREGSAPRAVPEQAADE